MWSTFRLERMSASWLVSAGSIGTMDFTKRDKHAPEGFFEAEAAGLRWLAEAGGVRVVEVRSVSAQHLTLQRLTAQPATHEDAARFGRALAHTHAAGADAWGAPPPYGTDQGFIGPIPQLNQPEERWGLFYARHRVRPFAEMARDKGRLAPEDFAVVERVCERLEAGDFDDDRPPARIHGDLWAGNVITTSGGWTVIDPSAHGGHPLTDLAMLLLFGNPHLDRTLSAYADAAALPTDWRTVVPLHQLHPLLVHTVLFGGGYGASAVIAARRYAG